MLKTHHPDQARLQEVVHLLFPNNRITVNAVKASSIYFEENKRYLELDIWIPDLNLAFEYQDPHHYATVFYGNDPIADVHYRDNIKHAQVTARGATLITVPCWWDGKVDSLVATIQSQRSDLLRDHEFDDTVVDQSAVPIPAQPPTDFFRAPIVPGVGELMLAFFPNSYEHLSNRTWWASEKYDGVRACWNGAGLYSRYGKQFDLTSQATSYFPENSCLDGEVWFGRGNYLEKTKSAFSAVWTPEPTNFFNTIYVVFDTPTSDISREYESRYDTALNLISRDHPFITIVASCECRTTEQRFKLLESITKEKGEGIILRGVKSEYTAGRSENLLKCKVMRDIDGLVIELDEADSICRLQLPDNTTIHAVLSLEERLKVGDIVSFQFEDFDTAGKPFGARVTQKRADISWVDALRTPRQNTIKKHGEITFQEPPQVNKPRGYWTVHGVENTKKYFDEYALSQGFDPLVPANWYPVTRQQILSTFKTNELGPLTSMKLTRNLHRLLIESYPDIGLDPGKFRQLPKSYWKNNPRIALENFARRRNFDPLVAKNWYGISLGEMFSEEKGTRRVRYGTGYKSFYETLINVFPEVIFEKEKFGKSNNFWAETANRKKFFDSVAQNDNFDPLVAENWYTYKREAFFRQSFAKYYNYNIVKALRDVYPTLSLDPTKFVNKPLRIYEDVDVRRNFFESVAKKYNLDPLLAESWYNFGASKFTAEKGGTSIIDRYPSFADAVIQCFPEIHFDKSKFRVVTQNFWKIPENCRALLTSVAQQLKFDPLDAEKWYALRYDQYIRFPKVHSIVQTHNNKLADAVMFAFPEIGLDRSKFTFLGYWLEKDNRRRFFEKYAEKHGFDPLIAKNWYDLSFTSLRKEKHARAIEKYCRTRKLLIYEALAEVFPELTFDFSLFTRSLKLKKYKDILQKLQQKYNKTAER